MHLRNSVYNDSLNSFANTVECCYQMPDVETGESMTTFQCFIVCNEFTITSHALYNRQFLHTLTTVC